MTAPAPHPPDLAGATALNHAQAMGTDSPAPVLDRWPDANVLVVDDEPGMRHFLVRALAPRAALVHEAASAEAGAALLAQHRYDLLVLDIALPGQGGIDWLRQLRAQGDDCEVVLITAFADLDTAIEALRAGAGDLLLKPFRVTQLVNAYRKGMERARLRRENRLLRRALSDRTPPSDGLVGRSIVVRGLQSALRQVAQVDSTVLFTGESGTGKELAALSLHRLSAQGDGPFVAVNCATTDPAGLEAELFGRPGQEGLLVAARGGTLFLDQVAELAPPLQAALLRVLETRRVRRLGSQQETALGVRIIAASSRPLDAEVLAGRFRGELFHRLKVVEIRLPPLRAHREDIPDLVAHFVHTLSGRLGVPPIAVSGDEMAELQQHDWPGNVRELRNLIERSLIVGALHVSALHNRRLPAADGAAPNAAAVQATTPGAAQACGAAQDHPAAQAPAPAVAAPPAGPVDLQTLERRHILAVLDSVGGDKTQAARLLGVSRRTLERRFAEWTPTV